MRLDWKTPKAFYDKLNEEFQFDFDPCPPNPQFDGLAIEWGGSTYCNPPYGRKIGKWIKKAYEESLKGKTVVMLIPARPDTKMWQDIILPHAKEIRFIRGRLKFDDQKNPAPFPSAVIIF